MNQRGFLSTLALQLIGGVGAVALLLGLWAYVQGLRSSLEACERTNLVLSSELEAQNEAVRGLEKASKAAQERSRKAQASLEASRRTAASEISRLKASKGSTCSDAVQQIRSGLGK